MRRGKEESVVGSTVGTYPQFTGLTVAGGEPMTTSPPPSPAWMAQFSLL